MHGGCFHRVNHGGDVWCGAWEEGKFGCEFGRSLDIKYLVSKRPICCSSIWLYVHMHVPSVRLKELVGGPVNRGRTCQTCQLCDMGLHATRRVDQNEVAMLCFRGNCVSSSLILRLKWSFSRREICRIEMPRVSPTPAGEIRHAMDTRPFPGS